MNGDSSTQRWTMRSGDLDRLVAMLIVEFDEVIGPVVLDGVIRLRPIEAAADLPAGVTDTQDAAIYRLHDDVDDDSGLTETHGTPPRLQSGSGATEPASVQRPEPDQPYQPARATAGDERLRPNGNRT